ncbi:hypothetical protein [Streptomyces sp. NPDC006691]|uniref:hypothetical protein n=1 Tax=Streptomyces sp. NPDC006691 TaxID=3364757 RepID=UPI0036CF1199
MTFAGDQDIHQAAARAALGVPGVAALQPGLADRLAAAASRAQQSLGAARLPPEARIRTEHKKAAGT